MIELEQLDQRLMRRVTVGHESGCWVWQGGRSSDGYGVIRVAGSTLLAHRVAAAVWLGFDVTSDLHVCHACDNPPCIYPGHLFVGTHADNVADRDRKGRASGGRFVGEANPSAKLTASDVAEIRARLADGEHAHSLAKAFGVSYSLVRQIRDRKIWREHG